MTRLRLVFGAGLALVVSFALTLFVVHRVNEPPRSVDVQPRLFQDGATAQHLTAALVVDAHVIGVINEGDCGPLGPHTDPCRGARTIDLAVSLLNTGTSPELVPKFEARCERGEHAGNGTAPAFKTGDTIAPGVRVTDVVTFEITGHRCDVPLMLIYPVNAQDGDPAIAVSSWPLPQ